MSNSPEKADKNNDGKISRDELEERLKSYSSSKSSKSSSSSSSKSKKSSRKSSASDYRFTTLEERLDNLGVSGSSMFVRNDKNRDGQLQMAEFAYSWSTDKVDEFKDYDLNGDGVITPQEWVTVENEK
jgi:Ca2+-binding EF-hand superfamily protein